MRPEPYIHELTPEQRIWVRFVWVFTGTLMIVLGIVFTVLLPLWLIGWLPMMWLMESNDYASKRLRGLPTLAPHEDMTPTEWAYRNVSVPVRVINR